LHKELEKAPEAAGCAADLKKAKVGLINLQAYMNQVDCIEFATAINNQVIFNFCSKADWFLIMMIVKTSVYHYSRASKGKKTYLYVSSTYSTSDPGRVSDRGLPRPRRGSTAETRSPKRTRR
jgi:hypothetical protein